jgi:hypothetical protein
MRTGFRVSGTENAGFLSLANRTQLSISVSNI